MSLPILETYAFPVTLPSNSASITIRPFLVKEEKLLLLAQESSDPDEQIEAVAQVIRNCTHGKVDPRTAPYFDMEYLLVQLRARSVGERITPQYICNQKRLVDGVESDCGHQTKVEINLFDVVVKTDLVNTINSVIELSPRFLLYLKFPTLYTVNQLLAAEVTKETDEPQIDKTINRMIDLFDTLEDKETQTLYSFNDYTEEEKIEFLNNLSPKDYEKIIEYVGSMPTVTYTTSFTCQACQFNHTITLSGMTDFLD